ncbi:MAG: PIG-L deacetylase family protein [Pseudonocardiaceae bacterium]
MRRLRTGRLEHMLLLGAHCDDVAIGSGGTLLTLCRAHPALRVTSLVLTGGGSEREAEERNAMAAFCPKAELTVSVLELPDGRVPAHWEQVKLALEQLNVRCDPDLILAPHPNDAHQDHQALASLVPTVFRDHLLLGYEILKWDGDLAQPQGYIPLLKELVTEKVGLLWEHYPSQRHRSWFDQEALVGLARVRGVQCGARYAEAFHVPKLVFEMCAEGR